MYLQGRRDSFGRVAKLALKLGIAKSDAASPLGLRASNLPIGNGVDDDTNALDELFQTGGILPPAAEFYRISRTLKPRSKVNILGMGAMSLIRKVAEPGSPVEPVIDCPFGAEDITLDNFCIDGGANIGLSKPVVYNGNIFAGSAVLVQSSRTTLRNLRISNSWDNGLAIGACDTSRNGPIVGEPRHILISNIYTAGCGRGSGAGAGVNLGSVFGFIARGLYDEESQTGVSIDFGGGASGVISSVYCFYPARTGLYVGSQNCQISDVQIVGGCSEAGIFLDSTGGRTQLSNMEVKGPSGIGVHIKGSGYRLSNICVVDASQSNCGVSDAYLCDASSHDVRNVRLGNCSAFGTSHRYGFAEKGSNINAIDVSVDGGVWEGLKGPHPPSQRTRFHVD